jgi:hypothetical protein
MELRVVRSVGGWIGQIDDSSRRVSIVQLHNIKSLPLNLKWRRNSCTWHLKRTWLLFRSHHAALPLVTWLCRLFLMALCCLCILLLVSLPEYILFERFELFLHRWSNWTDPCWLARHFWSVNARCNTWVRSGRSDHRKRIYCRRFNRVSHPSASGQYCARIINKTQILALFVSCPQNFFSRKCTKNLCCRVITWKRYLSIFEQMKNTDAFHFDPRLFLGPPADFYKCSKEVR